MPRKRMIDPSFWRDEKIGRCSFMERLLFEGLWTFAEDNGVGRASPLLLKADVFPYDTLREADIEKSLAKLASLGLILLYEIDGQRYYFVSKFKKHQTINRPTPSTLPLPLPEHYVSTHGGLTPEDKLNKEEDNLKEDKGAKSTRFTAPTLEEVADYCLERKNGIDAQRFIDFYEAKGWMIGKNKMKDWQSAVRTWEQRDAKGAGARKQSYQETAAEYKPPTGPDDADLLRKMLDKQKTGG